MNYDFEKFKNTTSGRCAAQLLARSPVECIRAIDLAWLYHAVYEAVNEALPGMDEGCKYTVAMLFYPEIWSGWKGNAAGRVAGICLSYLVRIEAVPLELHTTPRQKGIRKYTLRPLATRVSGATQCVAPQSLVPGHFEFHLPLSAPAANSITQQGE